MGKKRKPKQAAESKTPDGLRGLADELREIASKIDLYAQAMEVLDVGKMRMSTGNFNNAKKKILEFITSQISNRLALFAVRRGSELHDVLANLNRSSDS